MLDTTWIKSLKAGDTVIIRSGRGLCTCTVARVSRVTASGRIVVGTMTFNPNGLQRTSDRYSRVTLLEATEERLKGVRQNLLATKLSQVTFNKLPLETLEAIEKLLGDPK